MDNIPFQQVDVFTAVPFKGNPVAVVLEGDGFSTAEMQAIANWTNLSETTFVCRPTGPEADYRLRIFTPRSEIPFAGHPTIGSAHALLYAGRTPRKEGRLVQECGRGLVTIRIDGEQLFLALPQRVHRTPTAEQVAAAADALGIESAGILRADIIDVGPIWFTLQLRDADEVRVLEPDMAKLTALASIGVTGVTVFGRYATESPADIEVRSFAPAEGVPEDPVCGSGNGCVAALIQRDGALPAARYTAAQGRRLGRDGRVQVCFDDDGTIWIGGSAVTCIQGSLTVKRNP